MTVTAVPDLGAAIMLYLQDSSEILAFTSSRIFLEWPINKQVLIVPKFQNCILINTGVGGVGDIGLGLRDDRVDILCYGANRKTSFDLWRTVEWWLCPKDRSKVTSFKKANTQVNKIDSEGGILRLQDSSASGWPYVAASYRFVYSGVPAS